MEAHKPDLGIQILGLFNPKQGRKYRTYQFDLLITENEFKHISTKVSLTWVTVTLNDRKWPWVQNEITGNL